MVSARDTSVHYNRVRAMMLGFEQDCPEKPTIPDEKTRILRARLIMEEALELIEKGLGVYINRGDGEILDFENLGFIVAKDANLVEIADGCADLSVVNVGTLIACGIPDAPLLAEVDANNLEKVATGRKCPQTGKFLKSPDHKPPQIERLLEELK